MSARSLPSDCQWFVASKRYQQEGDDVARTEDRWWSLSSVPDAVWSVASVPAAAGHVSLGAAVLVGQSMTQVLRAASRALDHVAATTGEVRILDRLLRRRTAGSEPDALLGTDTDHVSG